MRSHCMLRPSLISCLPQSATLFSAWQATTQAPQPVQRSRSITIPHLYGLVIFSIYVHVPGIVNFGYQDTLVSSPLNRCTLFKYFSGQGEEKT